MTSASPLVNRPNEEPRSLRSRRAATVRRASHRGEGGPTRPGADPLGDYLAALAHPVRRQILQMVHFWGDELAAGEIARCFRHAWPTTTRHLQVLEGVGLLVHERRGRSRVYRCPSDPLKRLREWVGAFEWTASQKRKA